MPYINYSKRESLDEIVDLMVQKNIKADGDLNYILFKFCRYYIKSSYNNYKNFIGELTECGEEIRRRILADYEDNRRIENGDV